MWKQIFHATWKTFRPKFQATLSNLQRHKILLENQANLLFFQQYQVDREKTELEFRNIEHQTELNRQSAVANWLAQADSESDQRVAASVRQENSGSGRWLLEQQQMKRWLDPKYTLLPLLWINGRPGAGKTILASLIVEECRIRQTGGILFFYNKYGDAKRNTFIGVMRSLLAQMLKMRPILLPYMFEESSRSGTSSLEDEGLAKALFQVALQTFDHLFVVLDGLDECLKGEKKLITTFFRTLVELPNSNAPVALRCCFFSQDDNDTSELLKGIPAFTVMSDHNSEDICAYCKLRAQKIQKEFGYPEDKALEIAQKVATRADGMIVNTEAEPY